MIHLDGIELDGLHEALEKVEGKQPIKQPLTAIPYKNGVTQTELAKGNDTCRRTIYNPLKRFDTNEPRADAETDGHRSGKNRKLVDKQLEEFRKTVREPPTKAGDDELA